jgi:hypothetical protein
MDPHDTSTEKSRYPLHGQSNVKGDWMYIGTGNPCHDRIAPGEDWLQLVVDNLIEEFIGTSICTGNGIRYPKPNMNAAIVASVVRIGDLTMYSHLFAVQRFGCLFPSLTLTMLAPSHLNH